MASPLLFTPFRLRGLELANRIVVSPMGQYSCGTDGCATDWHLMHLGSFAVSGASLTIIEATSIDPEARVTPNCLGVWTDEQERALERVVAFCHEQGGSAMGIQLMHSGRKGSISVPWEGAGEITPAQGGWQTLSPSAVAYPGRAVPPRALSRDDLAALKQRYVEAAERSLRAGFDLLEMHNAHGYLLHSFLSPLSNFREDEYGGSLENRMRFPLEVFDALRKAWPKDKPLGVRISATDWAEGGWTLDDSVAFARALREAGCDYITASSGGGSNEQKIPVGPGYQLPFAERIRREVDIPTMGVGLITEARQAEAALAEGQADLIALGRGMIYNPRWAWHAAEQLGADAFFPRQYARSHPTMRKLGPLEYARLVRARAARAEMTRITGQTRVFAILADPIHHVKTPQRINELLRARQIDAVMIPVHVAREHLEAMAQGLRRMANLGGFVVTVPHKTSMLALCDEATPAAARIGAVNVVRRTPQGRLVGGMLDGEGFVAGLRRAGLDPAGRSAYLAGAGGAASAIAFALAQAGVERLTIANRTAAHAARLVARIAGAYPHLGVQVGTDDPSGHRLVVNATSLGLRDGDAMPLNVARLEPAQVVAEIIMEPAETPMLRAAKALGCRVHGGAPMLACQVELMAEFMGLPVETAH